MYPRLQGSREKVEHWRKAKAQKMLMWQLPTYVIYLYSLSNILMQEYVIKGSIKGSFCLKVLKLSTKFYNLSLNSYVITAIKINSKNVGWSSSRLPRLTSSKFLFLPSSKSTKSTTAEFSDFFSSSSPISREFQWKIVAASSILERHSLVLDHSDQPTTLFHSLFIIFLISWNSRCCVFVICCDGKPISCTQSEEVLEIDQIRNVWNCCAHKTQWSQSCSRGGRSWPPWPLPSPGMQGPERASRGSLGPSPHLPCSPMNLNLASSSSCNCVPLSNNKQVRPHGMSRNARLSSLQTMSLPLMRTSIKFHTCYSSLSPRSILEQDEKIHIQEAGVKTSGFLIDYRPLQDCKKLDFDF